MIAAPVLLRSGIVRLPGEAQVEAEVRKAGTLGDLPVVVLSHGKGIYTQAQQRLAALSTRGRFQVAEQSGHHIQADQPELVVQPTRRNRPIN